MTIISIYSSKGGVGKTFLASNIAAHLSINLNKKVLLLDLGGDYTNSSLFFKVIPKIIKPLWKGIMITEFFHYKLYDHSMMDENDFKMLESLNKIYDYTIIDLPPAFSENIISVLKKSDKVLLVTIPTFLSLYSNLLVYKYLKSHKIDPDIVVNMFDNKVYSISDISALFDKNVLSVIPYSSKVKEAESLTIPYILYKKSDKISREIYSIVYTLTGRKYVPNSILYKIKEILAI